MKTHTRSLIVDVLVVTPPGAPDPAIAIAGSRAGAIGALDLRFGDDEAAVAAASERLCRLGGGRWAVVIDAGAGLPDCVRWEAMTGLRAVVVTGERLGVPDAVAKVHSLGALAFAEARDVDEAMAAEDAGADAVIAKGHEAGGWVGEEGSFVLLQRCKDALECPVWAHGGIGLSTASACAVAGAAGVVLDSQLLLARESPLPAAVRERIARMDGSETVCAGGGLGAGFRFFSRPGQDGARELEARAAALERAADEDADREWRAEVSRRIAWDDRPGTALAIGQDAAFAAGLAHRFVSVGGIVAAIRDAAREQLASAQADNPLVRGGALARSHGTEYPIVQGPMTRVSDTAEFAAAVAGAGALPFLALALLRGPEVAALLERASEMLGDRPWGVGILGFVPAELREEQLDAIRAARPPFALIAGGRPDQARMLEEHGTVTYLHVPSPALLNLYLDQGAKRFVFEGRECGGHVGPRTSFVLWESMVQLLLRELPAGESHDDVHVLFAGGIHDGRSAAMVAAIAAPLAALGVRVGVLMGTAYLFTDEAVQHGAITSAFQQAAIAGTRTVLLESGPGHATRCLESPFANEFADERARLMSAEEAPATRRDALEALNIGRLRIATKGLVREAHQQSGSERSSLTRLRDDEQWQQGLYMIGQVAAMHRRAQAMADLHDELVRSCADRLAAATWLPEPEPETAEPPPADIAIVGIGVILPGAADAPAFWRNIVHKVDAVTEIPATRWDWQRYFDTDRSKPDRIYSRWGGFIDDVEFDPVAFGMPPNSLMSIEPFQLLGLLTAQAALRDAGYQERPFPRERTAVIFGAGGGGADLAVGYTVRSALPALIGPAGEQLVGTLGERLPTWTEDSFPGLLMNVAAGRIANRLDLGGMNFTVDAACGSSLAAITLAVRDLQAGMSDMAVVGGVDAIQNPFAYLCFAKTQALSPSGRCRPFDATADGIAISEGFAAVILKRRTDAERDGDRIYALIRGVGASSDGRDRSLTAPRPEGQMRALQRAYAHAAISPSTVGLVEAHGTGTVAGDRAEIEALRAIYEAAGARREGCAIGSVKSMIGHTKATAGVAGLIKAALALHTRVLPPTLGVTEPNPRVDFPATPFYVNTEARPWVRSSDDPPRRAAVSAFGFGGTNFHVVLEEYTGGFLPDLDAGAAPWPAELLIWRRQTVPELREAIDELVGALERGARPALPDLAYTLTTAEMAAQPGGPTLAIVADSLEDLRTKLDAARTLMREGGDRIHALTGVHFAAEPMAAGEGLAFLFPGQGSQYVDMGRELAVLLPEARARLDRADRVLAGRHPELLSRFIFPPPAFTDDDRAAREAALTQTDVAQPAIAAIELAYLDVLRTVGVEPAMAAGHSFGEFVALSAAASLGEDDLLRVAEARGRLIREEADEDGGAMAAIDAGAEAVAALPGEVGVVLANLNGPHQTVISGPSPAIERALEWCKGRGLRARRLPTACAFHSPLVAPAQRRLAAVLSETPVLAPRIPVFSNTTAGRYADEPAAITETLARHLVEPVAFVEEILAMHEAGARFFLEVGPRNVLTGLVSRILDGRPHVAVPVDQPGRGGDVQLLHALAALSSEGVAVRLERLFRGRAANRLDLTTLEPLGGRSPRSRTAWLVNGARARPASEPALAHTTRALELDEVMASNGNGNGSREVSAPPAPAPRLTTQPDTRTSDAMSRHHQVMQQFLEMQKAVMLAYLGHRPAADGGRRPDGGAFTPSLSGTPMEPVDGPAPTRAQSHRNGAAPDAQPGSAPLDIAVRLLDVVSERTGFPVEMLGLDADLEAELGIDSIKRVEIAGTMTQEMRLADGVELDVEDLTASRTLRQIIAVLEGLAPGAAEPQVQAVPFEREAPAGTIDRYLLQVVPARESNTQGGLAEGGQVLIVGEANGLGEKIAGLLSRRGENASLVPSLDAEAVAPMLSGLRERRVQVKALVYLAALEASPSLAALLLLLQGLRGDLEAAAHAGGAAIVGVTGMGGTFGLDAAGGELDPTEGIVPGVLKSVASEWPTVRVKVVDVARDDAVDRADRVLEELFTVDGPIEVGLRGEERTTLEPIATPVRGRDAVDPLDESSVVLITGGARGITAQVAITLAERYSSTIVLVGRSRLLDEHEHGGGALDADALRRQVIERRRAGDEELSPRVVNEEVRQVLAASEVRATAERIRACGARVEYRTCDVRDTDALGALVEELYASYGRIDGVIHGAGVIEDKLVRDKDVASAERVFATKADSARALVRRLRPETLRFLVLFSSVSGRFGNRGQADYAAASEVLNKLAQQLDCRWPGRVVAVNWGPWATGGMITPEVARQFAERGVALISVEEGCRRLDEELRQGRKGEVEVVIGGLLDPQSARAHASDAPFVEAASTVIRREPGRVEMICRLAAERDRLLADHQIDGVPVLPFAGAMELMAECAAAAHPDLEVTELREITLNQGIRVEDESISLRVAAVRSSAAVAPGERAFDVTIEEEGEDRPRYRSTVVLAERLESGPREHPSLAAVSELGPSPISGADAYAEYLFHGPLFQCIESIDGIGEQGSAARVRASSPAGCLAGAAPGMAWLLDPVLIDCALQMQVIWCRVHWGLTVLPVRIASYRRVAPPPAADALPLRHELRVQSSSRPPMSNADHRLYGENGLVAALTGVAGVGTKALNRLAKVPA